MPAQRLQMAAPMFLATLVALLGACSGSDSMSVPAQVAELAAGEPPSGACLLQREHAARAPEGKHEHANTEAVPRAAGAHEHKAPAEAGPPPPAGKPEHLGAEADKATQPAPSKASAEATPLSAGVMDGMGLDYSAQAMAQIDSTRVKKARAQVPKATEGVETDAAAKKKRNKITLMIVDMCPLCWVLGIDRLFLGNVGMAAVKLCVCICTCSIGGFVWGLLDFVTVLMNALKQEDSINTLGMKAQFGKDEVNVAFWLAFVDVLTVPVCIAVARWYYSHRKAQRMAKLREAGIKSPHYGGVASSQMKDG